MATHDYVIDNSTGANVRADINLVLQAILTNNSSSSAPSTTAAYMWWADTTNGVLKIRNSANNDWVELLQLDGTLTLEDGSASTPALAFRDDLDTGIFSDSANHFQIATAGVERVEFQTSEVVFNDGGNDIDFRVEGDNNANCFKLDAGNDRVGIGLASPTTSLHVYHASANGVAVFESGDTIANIAFKDNSTGSAPPAIGGVADDLKIITGDANRITVLSTGNVGVGTESPGLPLHIKHSTSNGILKVESGDSNCGITIADNSGQVSVRAIGNELTLNTSSSETERMRIDSSGRLLIGTTTNTFTSVGSSRLQVSGTGADTAGINLIRTSNDGGGAYLQFTKNRGSATQSGDTCGGISWMGHDGTDVESYLAQIRVLAGATATSNAMTGDILFETANSSSVTSERMRIDSSGNVGIGTTSPDGLLSIKGTTDTYFYLQNDSTGTASGNGSRIGFTGASSILRIQNQESSDIAFHTAGSERMRIDSSGRLLIGTTSTTFSTSSFGIGLFNDGKLEHSRNVGSSSSAFLSGGNAGQAKIFGDGDLENTNNSYGQLSDETLKQDIVDAATQWNDIKNLRVRKFRFKDNPTGALQIGVVAQEIETVSAGLVKTNDEGIKSVKYSVLYMKAVKCLQEAIAKIEVLETKVAALEAA
jgi:hypothetical protein